MTRTVEQIEDEAVFDEWRRYRGTARRSLARARLFARGLGLGAPGAGPGLGLAADKLSADELGTSDLGVGAHEPHRTQIPLIGVVGSKGKGTIALYASAALAAAGHRVGTVMSPGVLANRDRIRVNGRALTEAQYRDLLDVVRQAKLRLPPVGAQSASGVDGGYLSPTGTFTLAGAYALVEAGCTAIVLEAGIGGASDELSLFEPDVVAVGAIFGEHLDLLGPTVLDVARDKLGIVRDRTQAIVTVPQDHSVGQVIRAVAQAHRARVEPVPQPGDRSDLTPLTAWLPPGFGTQNALAGILAARTLLAGSGGNPASEGDLIRLLKTVRYPGRLSVHETGDEAGSEAANRRGKLILDTAVSRDGLSAALAFAERTFGGPPDRVLVSLPAAKDFEGFLAELRALDCPRFFVELSREHLAYPGRDRWPWPSTWLDEGTLTDGLLTGNVLAVGTVSFVTALMNRLHFDAEQLFIP
jgi:dihydrofolate synthase / folylpolyglutamate synthase